MNDFQGSAKDERLRRLLNDAVSDVDPLDTLDSIRSRTGVSSSRAKRPWFLGVGAAVVATAATIAAVAAIGGNPGITGTRDPRPAASDAACKSPQSTEPPSPSEEEPSPSGNPSDSASSPRVEEMAVPVYFLGEAGDGLRLFRELRYFEATESNRGTAAVSLALGPACDPDYRSAWPTGVEARSVSRDGGVITVDLGRDGSLREPPDRMSADEASLAVEQLIYTAQGAMQMGRRPVQFLLDGQPTDTLLGIRTSQPLTEAAASQVLTPVWVDEPVQGATVTSPFQVYGVAAAIEANVQWELRQGDTVVRSDYATAAECCTHASYAFQVTAPPGKYTIAVSDTNESSGEGFPPTEDTRTVIVVRP
ncbi:MAG: Gmad2 immunoglobulin-like domain-containing protein [Nocardioidaceae bacterium]